MAHSCLNYRQTTILQRWQLTSVGKTLTMPIKSRLRSNNGDVRRDAALAGHGKTKLPTFLVEDFIKDGRLQIVHADYSPTQLAIFARYAFNKFSDAKNIVLIECLVK